MSDSSIWSTWVMWVGVVAVVILAAAVLLLLVNMAARRILKLAVAALGLVRQIKDNTASVWALDATNKTAVKILADAKLIRAHGALVAQALHDVDLKRS